MDRLYQTWGLINALTYYAVLCWNALPDGVHFAFYPLMRLAFAYLRLRGYIVYEDGSIGW